ncbi:hypothetical protein [Burkholderia ambifaria]|uniref:hypothetical protein n=1 Tax=Burkholderia ambifaria TaxID=152480 RepID=UPI001E484D57|nr:hypothetical protein [Burkholderia ambifaria]
MTLMKSLGRSIGPIRKLHDNRNALAEALLVAEQRIRDLENQVEATRGTPFFAYYANFDALECMRRHEVHDRKPTGLACWWTRKFCLFLQIRAASWIIFRCRPIGMPILRNGPPHCTPWNWRAPIHSP